METAVRQIGNSLGVLLPKSVLDALGMRAGDTLSVYVEPGETLVLRKMPQHVTEMRPEVEALITQYADVLEALGND